MSWGRSGCDYASGAGKRQKGRLNKQLNGDEKVHAARPKEPMETGGNIGRTKMQDRRRPKMISEKQMRMAPQKPRRPLPAERGTDGGKKFKSRIEIGFGAKMGDSPPPGGGNGSLAKKG